MAGKQDQLVGVANQFIDRVEDMFGYGHYHIAVLTTGMESDACPPCVLVSVRIPQHSVTNLIKEPMPSSSK